MDAADIFLAVYLPYVVGTHFLRLAILEAAQKSAAGPAAGLIETELAALPVKGPQIVSAVWQVESILETAGHAPPPPPRTSEEQASWQAAIFDALRPHCVPTEQEASATTVASSMAAMGAVHAARALGDAEQTIRLHVLVDRLRAAHPDEGWLRAQHDRLEKARTAVLPHFRDLVGEGSAHLAAPLGLFPGEALGRAMKLTEAGVDPARRAEAAPILGRQAAIVASCMKLPRPRAALADVRAGKLDWHAALRPLLHTPGWSFFTDRSVATVHRVFSDADAVREAGVSGTCITTTAWAALQHVDPNADGLVIDPGLPHETRIPKGELASLRRLCASAGIESIVRDWGDVHLPSLQTYEGYRVLYDDTRIFHVWAPGAGSTPFVAVLPSEDALAAYVAKVPAPEGAKRGFLPGTKLFPMLASLNPAGIVFDPLGPLRPRWFGRPFLDQLVRDATAPNVS